MSEFHVTILLHQWDIKHPDFDAENLRHAGVTHITLPIMWSRVETSDGIFDFGYYDPLIVSLTAAGFKLILVLDAGGRPEFDDEGLEIPGSSTLPHHIRSRPELLQTDFYGEIWLQISFAQQEAVNSVALFFEKCVGHFGSRFREHIFAFGIGIQNELEIKYGQSGYRWRDYGGAIRQKFQRETGHEAPVIDYGRSIAAQTVPVPAYGRWIRFRERALVECITRLGNIIRSAGFVSISYFGEFFSSHDAIMGLGVIGELSDVLDAAVVDYNFYDGWHNQSDPWKVPLLANYARNIGYKYVFGGFYVERWRQPVGEPGSPVDPAIFPVVAQSLFECRWHRLIDGMEIGGFGDMARDLRVLRTPMLNAAINHAPKRPLSTSCRRIGLFASHHTFEWFVGEHDHNINIHSEALTRSFAMFSAQDRYEIIVISEKTLFRRPEVIDGLDAIYVPHQPALPGEVRHALTVFALRKLLIQDMRLGEWDENGRYRADWLHGLFGIHGIEWANGGMFSINGESVAMPASAVQAHSHALLLPLDGARVLAPSIEHPGLGLIVVTPNTIALGYVPALIEGRFAKKWQDTFLLTLDEALHKIIKLPNS